MDAVHHLAPGGGDGRYRRRGGAHSTRGNGIRSFFVGRGPRLAQVMTSARARVRGVIDHLLCAHANLLFSGSRGVGALLVAAAATEPRYAALGSCSVVSSLAVARRLNIEATAPAPYGYNALLVGFGIANTYALDGGAVFLAAVMGALSTLVTAALLSSLGRIAALPVLSLPFIVLASLGSGTVPHLPLSAAIPAPDLWAAALPPWLATSLESFGAILFLPRVLAGSIVFVALVWHSRISAMLAASGIAVTFLLAGLAHAPFAHRLVLAASFNAALTSIAV